MVESLVFFAAQIDTKALSDFITYCEQMTYKLGAEERTRTSTPLRVLHPECSASANFATSAQYDSCGSGGLFVPGVPAAKPVVLCCHRPRILSRTPVRR